MANRFKWLPRYMAAKYDGACSDCGAAFAAGDLIHWTPRGRVCLCAKCAQKHGHEIPGSKRRSMPSAAPQPLDDAQHGPDDAPPASAKLWAVLRDAAGRVRLSARVIAHAEEPYTGALLYLELYSSTPAATRAVWANIVKARTARRPTASEVSIYEQAADGTQSNPKPVIVTPGQKYYKREQDGRLVIIAPSAGRFERVYILDGTPKRPAPHFADALAAVDLPFLPHWAAQLWQAGQRKKLIEPCPARNMTAWHLTTDAAKWQAVLLQLHAAGRLPLEPSAPKADR